MSTRAISVAILDDDQAVRNALGRLLRAVDMLVASYATAAELFASLAEVIPDCLLLDLQMPETNGLDVLRQLKARCILVPTIIITAHDQESSRQTCLEAGAVGYLRKPLNTDQLIRMIVEISGLARRQ